MVADAMVGAITDFVKKKQPKSVCSVKIVVFQTGMLSDFHNSMLKVQGEATKNKGFLDTLKGIKGHPFIHCLMTQPYPQGNLFCPALARPVTKFCHLRFWTGRGESVPGALGPSEGGV